MMGYRALEEAASMLKRYGKEVERPFQGPISIRLLLIFSRSGGKLFLGDLFSSPAYEVEG
jgi:hypothetical protein